MITLVEGAKPPEDPQRNRPHHPARGAYDCLLAGGRHARTLRQFPQLRVVWCGGVCWCAFRNQLGGSCCRPLELPAWIELVQRKVAMSGRAVEAAGDVQTLLLDRRAPSRWLTAWRPRSIRGGHTEQELRRWGPTGFARPTRPPRPSIVCLARLFTFASGQLRKVITCLCPLRDETRMVRAWTIWQRRQIRKGAGDSVKRWATDQGGTVRATSTPLSSASRAKVQHH